MGKKKPRNTAMFPSSITLEGVLSVKQSIIAGLPTDVFDTVILEVCPASCKGCVENLHALKKSFLRREWQSQALAGPVALGRQNNAYRPLQKPF